VSVSTLEAHRRTAGHPDPDTPGRKPSRPAVPVPGRGGVAAVDFRLPGPPDDRERDSYLTDQHRWLGPATFLGYALIVISVGFFVGAHRWALWLLLPLAVSTLATAASLVTTIRRSRVSLAGHRTLVDTWAPDRVPSVDVFLPSAGEDLDVIANTFTYVAQLRWDGDLCVHVLDDSARPEVQHLADVNGFTYLTRPDRGHLKKAGNLLYGYQHSEGDLIAIFDADFVPRADFLHELVPYFDDPVTAIVQSPQYFDVHPGMNWLQRAAGATQVLFYRYVQPSRDASGAAICVGTSAMYRRAGLADSGGFAQISHSEDVHTGVNLMEAGYTVRYVATVVSKGTCPDTFAAFVTQQYRWCGGSMSLLGSRRFHRVNLTFMQRLCFWSGFLFYISTALDLITTAAPALLMAFFAGSQVRVQNYIFVLLALVVRQALIPFITGGTDSLVGLSRVQTVYSVAHLVQLWDLITRRKDEGWVATGAAKGSNRARRIIRTARVWLVGNQILLWGVVAWRTPEYGISHYWPMVAFGLLSLYVAYPIITANEHLPAALRVARHVVDTGRTRTLRATAAGS